jgi:hypothetical protein
MDSEKTSANYLYQILPLTLGELKTGFLGVERINDLDMCNEVVHCTVQ